MKISIEDLKNLDQQSGDELLSVNGYLWLSTKRDPETEEWIHPYILLDDSDPENDDPDIIHTVYYSFFRIPNTNVPDPAKKGYWWEGENTK